MALKYVMAMAGMMMAFNTAAQADQKLNNLGGKLSAQVSGIIPNQMLASFNKLQEACADQAEDSKKACFTTEILKELNNKFKQPCATEQSAPIIAEVYMGLVHAPELTNEILLQGWRARYNEEDSRLNRCDWKPLVWP
jgi:hypothetical protein